MKKLQIALEIEVEINHFFILIFCTLYRAPCKFSIVYLLIYLHKDLRRMELLCFHGIFLCYELLQLFS